MLARLLYRAIWCCGLAFSIAVAVSLWWIARYPYAGKLGLCCLVCAALLPRFTAVGLLMLLPLFGNKPATTQLVYLLLVQSALMIGIAARLLFDRLFLIDPPSEAEHSNENPAALLFLGMLYVLVSILSLSSVDLVAVIQSGAAHLFTSDPRVWMAGFHGFLKQDEAALSYPVLSVFLTIHAATFALQLVELGRKSEKFALQLSVGVLCGVLLAIVTGLLDYYGVLSLAWLRDLDPTANPGGVQFRLQSFFGHSGWFAEYLTLAVPFVLVLLALRIPYLPRVAAVLVVLLLGEWALILTFQRGGWVSYPVTLCAVWGAIYVGRRLELGERDVLKALRSSMIKVAISLPLTVALSFLVIMALSKMDADAPTRSAGLGAYVERFQDIQKTSDRTEFMYAGWLIGSLHPFLGAGSESFCSAFEREFMSPQGHFFGQIDLPLHGSAHNVYFQTFAGKGVAGVAILLVILVQLMLPSARAVLTDGDRSFADRLVLLCGACFAAAFLVYGMVQEIFYVQVLQLLFFSVLGAVSLVPGAHRALPRSLELTFFRFVGFMFFGHLLWEWRLLGVPIGPERPPQGYGCFAEEVDNEGRRFRWCTPRALQALPVEREGGERVLKIPVRLESMVHNPFGMLLEVSVGDESLAQVSVSLTRKPELLVLPIPDRNLSRIFTDGSGRERLLVSIRSNTWFVPMLLSPDAQDDRVLSYRLYSR